MLLIGRRLMLASSSAGRLGMNALPVLRSRLGLSARDPVTRLGRTPALGRVCLFGSTATTGKRPSAKRTKKITDSAGGYYSPMRSSRKDTGFNTNIGTVSTASTSKDSSLIATMRELLTREFTIRVFDREIVTCMSSIGGHLSFVILAASWTLTDMLGLRFLALIAGGFSLLFTFFHPVGQTLWLPFRWNLLFVGINVYHVVSLMLKRNRVKHLTDEEVELYESVFECADLSRTQFVDLLQAGRWRTIPKGTNIIEESTPNDKVFLIRSGQCDVFVGGRKIYEINEGQFVGEMGIRVGLRVAESILSSATVRTVTDETRLLEWNREALTNCFIEKPAIQGAFQSAVSADLVRKALDPHRTSDMKSVDLEGFNKVGLAQYRNLMTTILQMKKQTQGWNHTQRMMKRFRAVSQISEEDHLKLLEDLGWTREEYSRGYRGRAPDNGPKKDIALAVERSKFRHPF